MVRRLAACVIVFSLLAAGCGGGDGGDGDDLKSVTVVATRDQTPVSTPEPSPAPSVDIREVQLTTLPGIASVLSQNGGTIVQADVLYVDLTDDGIDDALAPVSSGGTLGLLGFFVVTPEGDSGRILLQEFPTDSAGLALTTANGKIEMTQPVPGPDDPECCPSFLRRTIFAWNGTAIAIESVSTDPAVAPSPTALPQ